MHTYFVTVGHLEPEYYLAVLLLFRVVAIGRYTGGQGVGGARASPHDRIKESLL